MTLIFFLQKDQFLLQRLWKAKLQEFSCLKLEGPGLWYLVYSIIKYTSNKINQFITLRAKIAPSQGHLFYIDSYWGKLFRHLLLRNHWANQSQISGGASLGREREQVWSLHLGHMTKMAAMPIYDKTHLKVFSGTKGQMTIGLGMQHWGYGPNKIWKKKIWSLWVDLYLFTDRSFFLQRDYRIYPKYWDILSTYHTCHKIWNSLFWYLLMSL